MTFKLLDLFCGAGGCSMGYHRAGFEVTGVDKNVQHSYPFKFIKADAMEIDLEGYDCYHASPPCQHFSISTRGNNDTWRSHPNLLEETRTRLKSTGKPYVIENVVGAPMLEPITLCGTMFKGLRVIRHRLFECNFYVRRLRCGKHYIIKRKKKHSKEAFVTIAGNTCTDLEGAKDAMGVDWMISLSRVTQTIPPYYTQYIGKYLADACNGTKDIKHYRPEWLIV